MFREALGMQKEEEEEEEEENKNDDKKETTFHQSLTTEKREMTYASGVHVVVEGL